MKYFSVYYSFVEQTCGRLSFRVPNRPCSESILGAERLGASRTACETRIVFENTEVQSRWVACCVDRGMPEENWLLSSVRGLPGPNLGDKRPGAWGTIATCPVCSAGPRGRTAVCLCCCRSRQPQQDVCGSGAAANAEGAVSQCGLRLGERFYFADKAALKSRLRQILQAYGQ